MAVTTIGMMDVEMAPPAQEVFQEDAMHAAPAIDNNRLTKPSNSDQFYSKLVCLTCGVGEILGKTVCGHHCHFFCLQEDYTCGLQGDDKIGEHNCIKCHGDFELFMPVGECGYDCKEFCCKCGVVAPWVEKELLIVDKKQIC